MTGAQWAPGTRECACACGRTCLWAYVPVGVACPQTWSVMELARPRGPSLRWRGAAWATHSLPQGEERTRARTLQPSSPEAVGATWWRPWRAWFLGPPCPPVWEWSHRDRRDPLDWMRKVLYPDGGGFPSCTHLCVPFALIHNYSLNCVLSSQGGFRGLLGGSPPAQPLGQGQGLGKGAEVTLPFGRGQEGRP